MQQQTHPLPRHSAVHHRRVGQGAAQQGTPLTAVQFSGFQQPAAARHGSHECRRGAAGAHLAVRHQQHVIAQLGLIEVGGAPEHRHASLGQLAHHLPEGAAGDGIDPDPGLVQQQHVGSAEQGAGQPQLLFHPARELARGPCGEAGEIGEGEQARQGGGALWLQHTAQVSIEAEVLLHAEILVEPELLGHVAQPLTQGIPLAHRIQPQHPDFPGLRHQQTGQQAQQCALACAVGAHQSGDAAGRNGGRDGVEGHPIAEALGEPGELDGGIHGCSLTVTGIPWRRAESGSCTTMRSR
ncbi:hypothetical protein D3C77_429130 [compost metagenome]